jgi:hypothetical protein
MTMSTSLPPAVTAFLDSGLEFVYSFQPYAEPTVVLGKLLKQIIDK